MHAGAAIWLLKNVDKSLAKEKFMVQKKEKENTKIVLQLTCLKLLAKMQLAFESTGTLEMGLTKRLLYECTTLMIITFPFLFLTALFYY